MQEIKLMPTGVPNLDAILGGGLPVYSLNIVAGSPGTGKTIMAQQIIFNHVCSHQEATALYLTTLSEPILKTVRYMQHFRFFNPSLFGERVVYHDLGPFIRESGISQFTGEIERLVEKYGPEIIVIDSFKAIRDLTPDMQQFRRVCYDLSVQLASALCTTFLVGEYKMEDIADGAEFAVADGILFLKLAHEEGEERRYIRTLKLRGSTAEMAAFPFTISETGIQILSHAVTLRRRISGLEVEEERLKTGIPGLDHLLRGGILRGHSVILSGASGTGKTTFALQFLVHGAQNGERGLLFSLEETSDRLRRMAEGFGWDLKSLEEQSLLRIVPISQMDIRLEENIEQMVREVEAFKPDRLVVDSFSLFLYRVKDPAIQREKTFQVATLVQRAGAVGVLISDIPTGEQHLVSRFGVEETVVDGTIVLSSRIDGARRRRYIEVYKMRAAEHVTGRCRMEITSNGMDVFCAPAPDMSTLETTPPLTFDPLQGVLRANPPYGSAWLVRGESGTGKSTLAYQFLMEGLKRGESGLYAALDTPAFQVREALRSFGLDALPYLEKGMLVMLDSFVGGRDKLDPTDPEAFLFMVTRQVEHMQKPVRIIFDSLTQLALNCTPSEFVELIHLKNRSLRRPDMALFDTLLRQTLDESQLYTLFNAFDIVLDLFTPDWGEMRLTGNSGYRVLQVRKARGVPANSQPYPYIITSTQGVVVQKDFYHHQVGQ